MRRISLKLVAIFAAVFAALSVTACSSDDPGLLPGDDAQQILANLDRVEELAANGECAAALESIETISGQIASLPDSVSDRLQQNLRRGVTRLSEVTANSCGAVPSDPEPTTETTTTEPETTPEEEEQDTGPTGEAGDEQTGPARGRGNDNGRGGQGGGPGNRPQNGQPPPGGNGALEQPSPGDETQDTPPDESTDSGGISPEEQTGPEATP